MDSLSNHDQHMGLFDVLRIFRPLQKKKKLSLKEILCWSRICKQKKSSSMPILRFFQVCGFFSYFILFQAIKRSFDHFLDMKISILTSDSESAKNFGLELINPIFRKACFKKNWKFPDIQKISGKSEFVNFWFLGLGKNRVYIF